MPSITPTSPLCITIWSSWLWDKVGSCLWNSLLLRSNPVTVKTTSCRVLFRVPPIFIRYVRATMLSIWRFIALTSLYFMNVCIASFTANNSRILMWYFISWADHIFPVDIPLQVAFQPFVEASACMSTCAGGWINYWPLQRSRFIMHHCNSVFDWRFRTICPYVNGFPLKVIDVNKPITFVNSKIDVSGSVSKFWDFVFTFCIFSSVRDISRLIELIFCPTNSISFTGVKTVFFQLITKPRCCNKKITVSRHTIVFSMEWPIGSMPSK